MSLRWRLFAAMLGALALTLALTIAIGAVLTRRQVDRTQASALAHSADQLAAQRRTHVSYRKEKDTVSGGVLQWVAERRVFAPYVPNVDRSSDGQTDYDGKEQLYSYRTLPHLGLLMLRPASSRAAAWRPFLGDLLLAALAGIGLAALLSFGVARSITRPIRRVAEATRRLAADEAHEPLPREGASELAALAAAFNQMAVELDASREAERAFLLSVSHELKTPLTAIRGWAEGLEEGAFGPEEAAGRSSPKGPARAARARPLAWPHVRSEFRRQEPVDRPRPPASPPSGTRLPRARSRWRSPSTPPRPGCSQTPTVCCRWRRTSSRTRSARRRPAAWSRSRLRMPTSSSPTRAPASPRRTSCMRSSASTSTTSSARTARSGAVSASPSCGSSSRRWGAACRSRAVLAGRASRSPYGRSREVSTTSKSEPRRRPRRVARRCSTSGSGRRSRTSWSRCRPDHPVGLQRLGDDPRRRDSFEMSTEAFSRPLSPIGGSHGSVQSLA